MSAAGEAKAGTARRRAMVRAADDAPFTRHGGFREAAT
jgi:hypothetical protein